MSPYLQGHTNPGSTKITGPGLCHYLVLNLGIRAELDTLELREESLNIRPCSKK